MNRLKPTDAIYARRRMEVVIGLMALALSLLFIRAVDLHLFQSDFLKSQASEQHFHQYAVAAARGNIVDRNGRILSKSIEVPSIGVIVNDLPKNRMAELSNALDIPLATLKKRIRHRKGFTWLVRQVSPVISAKVLALNVPGVRLETEWRRYYPLGPETGHVLGFVGIDGHGLEGIEHSQDKRLQGQAGIRLVQRDARGRALPGGVWLQEPRTGDVLTLTLDSNIQSIAYAALTEGVRAQQAKGGSVIVMDPYHGDILAMASWPGFNPNNFSRYKPKQWRNRAVTDIFEPGSSMKPFTIAAALEASSSHANSRIFCENGSFRVANYVIHDDHPEGWLDLTGIMARSSNIGAAKLALNLGAPKLRNKLYQLGFGQKTNVGLSGESSGILIPEKKWGVVETANIAFGQGIAVTPIQLASAFSVLANDGVKVSPRLFLSSSHAHAQRIFSSQTARAVTQMLIAATGANGTGKKAVPVGYQVAGKTGTAQKANRQGSYAKDKFTAIFAGFVPANHPKIVVVVVVDEPKKSIYGGSVAAPIFKNIASTTLPYLGVSPNTQASPYQRNSIIHVKSATPISPQYFMGLSLRESYQLASLHNYALRTHGSGWVVRQSPSSIANLPKGAEVEVWLHE